MTVTDPDELKVLEKFRQSKKMQHADGEWSVKNGKLVKLWLTDKSDLERPNLREGEAQ